MLALTSKNMSRSALKSSEIDGAAVSLNEKLAELASDVASACGFDYVPAVLPRRGRGGDWSPEQRVIRVGIRDWTAAGDRLWYVVAHELAHAQVDGREGHSRAFWRRLSDGLCRTGRLELIRHDFGYREGALRAAREGGLVDVPGQREFAFEIGDNLVDRDGTRWVIKRRFRRAGLPQYSLEAPGWTWRVQEEEILRQFKPRRKSR